MDGECSGEEGSNSIPATNPRAEEALVFSPLLQGDDVGNYHHRETINPRPGNPPQRSEEVETRRIGRHTTQHIRENKHPHGEQEHGFPAVDIRDAGVHHLHDGVGDQ